MRSNKDVEAFLLRMEKPWTEADDGTYLVPVAGATLAVKCASPVVLARVEIGDAPPKSAAGKSADGKSGGLREPLFEHLLHLNAEALVHSAYGLDGDRIVLSAALEMEHLDYNELEAVVAEFDLALDQQLPEILELAGHVAESQRGEGARAAGGDSKKRA